MTKRIFVGEGTAEATAGLRIARALFDSEPVQFLFGVRRSPAGLDILTGDDGTVSAATLFPGHGLRAHSHKVETLRLSYWEFHQQLVSGGLRLDAAVVVASPPDAAGLRRLGTVNGIMQAALDAAPVVVVEEDPTLPTVAGSAQVREDKVTAVIPHSPASYVPMQRQPDQLDYDIAENVIRLITAGAVLQVGVGGIVSALGEAFDKTRRVQVLSGAITTTVRSLVERQCVVPGRLVVGGAVVGDAAMTEWASSRPDVRLRPSEAVHSWRRLASIRDFYSVNAALSVDEQGNVNCELAGPRLVAGLGGAPDFARGAHLSSGGASIVALRRRPGESLVSALELPSLSNQIVDIIVTDTGHVDMRGLDYISRRRELHRLFD